MAERRRSLDRRAAPHSYAVNVSSTVRGVPVSDVRVREAAIAALSHLKIGSALISVSFVGAARIAGMNREHIGHRGPTDVISFALNDPVAVVGDVYICPAEARKHAQAQRVTLEEETLRLVVHGVLHVCGHEHPEGDSRTSSAMWKLQETILDAIR